MFFTEYDPLTAEIVGRAVTEKKCADGEKNTVLAGKRFTARISGEFAPSELVYRFGEDELTFTENGETFTVPYRAVCVKELVMVTHIVPGTSRGWHFVLNTKTRALVVFETWFGITVPVDYDLFGGREPAYYRDIPREIQREYYFGWADFGNDEAPEELFTDTNRLEGRGFRWQYDNGYELLTFSPAVNYTTVVELGPKEMGGITMCEPADYIRVNDELYIYARWEAEFSGKMWLEIIDLFEMKASGVDLGFEEDNSLSYRLHEAALEITGTAAHMEMIHNNGEAKNLPPFLAGKKGARYVYRPKDMHVPITHEEAGRRAAKNLHVLDNCDGIMDSGHNFPLSDGLTGKKFSVCPDLEKYAQAPWSGAKKDPFSYDYEILSADRLKWKMNGTDWQEEVYNCFEVDKDLFFFMHMKSGDPDFGALAQILDFRNGLATTIPVELGNWHTEWEAGASVQFGTLRYGDLKAPFTRRHHFTDELLGWSFAWNYTETMNSIHMYSSPESMSWTIFQPDNSGGVSWSAPCFYIKLREGVYVLNWIEENCNGNQGLVVINRKLQHDGGFFYGMYGEGLKLSITGAYMRELGKLEIAKYFDKDM